jgi:hypothetical protein
MLQTATQGQISHARVVKSIPMTDLTQQAEMFLNRVGKNYRHLCKWRPDSLPAEPAVCGQGAHPLASR